MTGSSPLARGPHQLPRSAGRIDGIIPARAGSTQPVCGTQKSGQDHPRSRGVHIRRLRCAVYQQGSSPLARGPLSMILLSHSPTRIIPARAGSTLGGKMFVGYIEDHPRSRGVHLHPFLLPPFCLGSSPLARGPLLCFLFAFLQLRIIPARAGSTTSPVTTSRTAEDHPRSRGVHLSYISG